MSFFKKIEASLKIEKQGSMFQSLSEGSSLVFDAIEMFNAAVHGYRLFV